MDVAIAALKHASTVVAPAIPGLGHVIQAAIGIANTVQVMEVSELLENYHGKDVDKIGPDLKKFRGTLENIQELLNQYLGISKFAFVIKHDKIARQVEELNEKLDDAMTLLLIGVTHHGNQSLGDKLDDIGLRISQADERQRQAHHDQQADNKEIIARLDEMEQLHSVMRATAGDGHAYKPPSKKGGAVRKYSTRSPYKQPESTVPLDREEGPLGQEGELDRTLPCERAKSSTQTLLEKPFKFEDSYMRSAVAANYVAGLHTALQLIEPFKAWLAEQQRPPPPPMWLQDTMGSHPQREYAQSDSPSPAPSTPGDPATTETGAGVYRSRSPDTYHRETPTGENVSATFRNKSQFTFASDGTTWLRRRSMHLRPGTTLTFRSDLPSNFFSATIPDKQPAIVMAYTLETILETVDTTQQTSEAPLWFFMLEHGNLRHHSLFDRRVPWGFWSTDENPTAIPSNIVFCPPLRSRKSAFPFMWQQKLGAQSFSIRARYVITNDHPEFERAS
ncbi:hypothetical protein TRAPUB_10571 [Trametes pubescens]|uniref:Uncharacterized protein n=1 Tax=Trametes pubescens TaxID=154538 RepID=A0A1M2VZ29_TRAPU|nr:hypothetical protein TRAPUB_10571 [Trametes pubescens]